MIKIKSITFNPFYENTIIIWSESTKEGFVIDPGMSNASEEMIFDNFIKDKKINLTKIINTHCHIDHILGCKYVKEKYSAKYLVPKDDTILLEVYDKQMSMVDFEMEEPPKPDQLLDESDEIKLGGNIIKPLLTPGHTPGEMCFLIEEENICITGDVLFKNSIGRTDLWGCDTEQLMNSISSKLLSLNDDIVIYPGHGETSTIGDERKNNPFLMELNN